MKHLVPIAALVVMLLGSLGGPAVAGEEPDPSTPAVEAQAAAPESADAASPAPALEELLIPPAQPVCSCRDLCRNDAQCVLLFGPGSQCVPVGPCACKECLATS